MIGELFFVFRVWFFEFVRRMWGWRWSCYVVIMEVKGSDVDRGVWGFREISLVLFWFVDFCIFFFLRK